MLCFLVKGINIKDVAALQYFLFNSIVRFTADSILRRGNVIVTV
jgi:hypothetical protein